MNLTPVPASRVPLGWSSDPAFKGMWTCPAVPGLSVLLTRTLACGYHLSVAHTDRLPTWDEVRDARYAVVPNEHAMALLLPPRDEYVNVHEHCLQLIEVHGQVRLRGDRWTTLEQASL
jgi:hypothetical protein